MKTAEVEGSFPVHVSTTTFKERMFSDPNFQQAVQEKMGHTKVVVGPWSAPSTSTTALNVLHTTYERVITFEAPVTAPPAVQTFLNLKTTSGMSKASMTIVGPEDNPERLEGVTIMYMMSGALKDNMSVTVHWQLAHVNNDRTKPLQLKVKISSEYKKKVPMIQSLLEKTCASAAKKSYETWIGMANDICKQVIAAH